MDVLTKLRNTVSNTISNTVQNTAYGLSQLSSVLPGNPVTREFEATAHIASAGPGLLWKVYSGYKKSTRQEAAIFVFEKRLLEKWAGKSEREAILETLKRGIAQLTKLRHPQILIVQHPLEESRDSLAFATEPVVASLANVLGNYENVPQPLPSNLKNYKLLDLEIRYGLLQLGEGLTFLHGDAKLLHRNLCPESIVVNAQGAWKIFGFDFCVLDPSPDNKQSSWPFMEYDPTIPPVVQPNLDYQAPECILASSNSPQSDIFSLGMLAYVIHSPDNRPLDESQNDLSRAKRFAENLKSGSLVSSKLVAVPECLRETLKLMLNYSPELRLDAHQFIKIDYFMDIGVKTLNYLDKLFQWDNLQKSQFYKGLPRVLKQLPHRVVLHRVLPALYKELVNPPMIPFVLPNILQVMENMEPEEFKEYVLPSLKPILALEDPPQITLILLQHADMLLKLCPADVIKTEIIPLLTRALESEWEQVQELCLSALPNIVAMIDGSVMKNAILPKMKKICLKTGANKSLGIRVSCLLCLAKLLPNFDRWLIIDQILPFLQEIPHASEPAILMALIGIYRMLLTHSKFGIGKEILATKMLPYLLPLCVEQNLSLSQFETLASLVLDMINKVTTEHREALRQLDAVRRETQQFDEALAQTVSATCAQSNAFNDIDLSSSKTSSQISSPNVTAKTDIKFENGLTLEEKYRTLQQREAHQRLQFQSPLTPTSAVSQVKKNQPKDLTATLLKNNLDELSLSTLTPSNSQPRRAEANSVNSANLSSFNWKQSSGVQRQPQSFAMQTNAPMVNWNSNGAMSPANQIAEPIRSTSLWNRSVPQGSMDPNWNENVNFGLNLNSNSNGSLQLLSQQKNTEAQPKSNLSNQDIIDLLS